MSDHILNAFQIDCFRTNNTNYKDLSVIICAKHTTTLGHSCGCVPLFRSARLSSDGSSCGQCEVCSIKHPKDEHMLSFAYE